jgi:nitroreductase
MLMANFLRSRKSAREFRNKDIKNKDIEQIQKNIDDIKNEANDINISYTFYKDGENIYESLKGIGGYAGVMVKSPSYIGLEIKDREDKSNIYGAYYTEKLVTLLNGMGIEACWLTMIHVDNAKREEVFGEVGRYTDYLLAIGYPPLRNPFDLLSEKISKTEGAEGDYLSYMAHSEIKGEAKNLDWTSGMRYGIEKIVFKDEVENSATIRELEEMRLYELFYYVRFAPSSRNHQPWRFLIKNNQIELLLVFKEKEDITLVDAGVIMYYFEQLINTMGNTDSKWVLLDGEYEGEKAKYKRIAEFKI